MTDECPRLPYRCGTMFLMATPEERSRMFDAWDKAELAWLEWYDRQPAEQLTQADHDNAAAIRQPPRKSVTWTVVSTDTLPPGSISRPITL